MENKRKLKTNYVPALVMLVAGALYCVIGLRNQVPVTEFTRQLFIVLIIFYILGGIVKVVLDVFIEKMANKPVAKEETATSEESSETEERAEEESTAE